MAEQFGQMNQDALSNMIDTFQNNLTSGSQEMMKNLAENLLEVSNKIEGVSSSMTNSEQFNTQLSKATDNLITGLKVLIKKSILKVKHLKKYQNLQKMLQIVLKIRRNLCSNFWAIRRDFRENANISFQYFRNNW